MSSTSTFDQELITDLHQRQQEHVKCLLNAKRVGLDINEACSLTAWKAAECYRDWARYRAPFRTAEAEAAFEALKKSEEQAKKQ